ncbi:MAG: carbohydrate ABC transporter permease [Anaerolineae bacterium]
MANQSPTLAESQVVERGTTAPTPAAARRRRGLARIARSVLRAGLIYLLMTVGAITFVFPFAWMLSTSLKTPPQVWLQPPVWIPNPIRLGNYLDAFKTVPTLLYLKNTLTVTVLALLGSVVSSALVAYSFSRLRWRGRNVLFFVLLSTMMLPSQVTMIPIFIMFHRLQWVNTLKPLIVPSFFGSAFYIFLLRQFFLTIPLEIDEAAIVDGANPLTIWWRIIVPLCQPALGAVAIFSFMGHWNDFMGPLIYLNRGDKWTLALGLIGFQSKYYTDWELLMAYSTMVMFPCLLVFFFFQRYFIQGIVLTGLKG